MQECFCWDGVCSHPYFPFARLLGPLARLLCSGLDHDDFEEKKVEMMVLIKLGWLQF